MTYTLKDNIAATFHLESAKHTDEHCRKYLCVLNLTDIHYSHDRKDLSLSEQRIEKIIKKVNPDVITLTGDQISFPEDLKDFYAHLAKFIDDFGVPWAPILGNHEGFTDKARSDVGNFLSNGGFKNIVFIKNAPELGVGNYLLNIESDNKIVHSIFMVDSHTDKVYDDGWKDYDYIWEPQFKWYKDLSNALAEANGGKIVPSSCFLHMPPVEYELAWRLYKKGLLDGENDNNEPVCCPKHEAKEGPYNNGFFDVAKASGTKLFLCGHDHTNTASINYQGVTLAYSFCTRQHRYCNGHSPLATAVKYYSDGSFALENYIWRANDAHISGNLGKFRKILRKLKTIWKKQPTKYTL